MLKKFQLLIFLLLVLMFVLNNFLLAANKPEQKNKVYLFLNGGINWAWDIDMCTIPYVPKRVRNVPVHSDDQNIPTNIAPINNASINYSPCSICLEGMIGVAYKSGLYKVKISGGTSYYLAANDHNSLKTRNYTNAPGTNERGDGAALTYYKLDKDWTHGINAFVPRLSINISRQFSKKSICQIFTEYDLSFYGLHLENGWDRYNRFEKWKIYKLADIRRNCIKFGLNVKFLKIYMGYVIPTANLTELGEISQLKIGPYWTIGFQYKFTTE